MKKLSITLVVLLALLLVADRAGAAIASRAVAAQVQTSAGLAVAPEVSIGGFPFLTQALGGRYDSVEVRALDVAAEELTVSRLEATLTGVEVPLSQALSGAVSTVPVRSVQATAVVAYAELVRRSGDRSLAVTPAGDRVRVTGRIRLAGQELEATAVSRVEVVQGDLLVTAESYEVGNQRADDLISRAVGERFDLRVPVEGLPYGLEVSAVEVRPEGVAVRAAAGATVLSRR